MHYIQSYACFREKVKIFHFDKKNLFLENAAASKDATYYDMLR